MTSLDSIPFDARISNALVSYLRYVGKTLWPTDLAFLYPYQAHWPVALVIAAGLFLATCSALAIVQAKRRPYLFVGWFWFLGTLVPTIGLVQVGSQSIADRYTYVPGIGLFVLLVWGLSDLGLVSARLKIISGWMGAAGLTACLACTSVQISYWQNSISLFTHATQVTVGNYVAYEKLGDVFNESGKKEDALYNYAQAVGINPAWAKGQYNLGTLLLETGRLDGAISHLMESVRLNPMNQEAQMNLGAAIIRQGRGSEAIPHFVAAVRLVPGDPDALFKLGLALLQLEKFDDAKVQFTECLRLRPGDAETHFRLGQTLAGLHRFQQAMSQYQESLRLAPQFKQAAQELALLQTSGVTEIPAHTGQGDVGGENVRDGN